MSIVPKPTVILASLALLAACMDNMGTGSSSGLRGTPDEFAAMSKPCITQASRMTGVRVGNIRVTDQLQTGGGPLLSLNVGGAKYSCRLEDNGSVTVFSEYAN